MRREVRVFAASDDGAAALEYGLIAAGIVLVLFAVFPSIGNELGVIADRITAGLAEIIALSGR